MPNDLFIRDGNGAVKRVKTTDLGSDVHAPHNVLTDAAGNTYGANAPFPVAPNVSRGAGNSDANTTRVVLAADGPAVAALNNIDSDIGAPNATAAAADGTGDYGVIAALKRGLLNWAALLQRIPALVSGRIPVDGSGVVQPSGGVTRRISASFNRPPDTTAYAAGDLVANSTTAGSVTVLTFAASRLQNGSGAIPVARMRKSGASVTNASFRLHLYRTLPTAANGDNAAWLTNNSANYIGAIDIVLDRVFNDGATGVGVPPVGSAINFDLTGTGSLNIFGLLEARGAYTPASSETFEVFLEVYQD